MGGVFLVTGSRSLPESERWLVDGALDIADPESLIVGDCPTGADRYAREWAKSHGLEPMVHCAEWGRLGRRAGPDRNSSMIVTALQLGGAHVLAFPRGGGPGTADCMRKARDAGFEIEVF